MNPEQFSKQLQQGLANLYCIYGEEDLLRFESLAALRLAAKKQDYLTREVLVVDTHFNWNDVFYSLQSPGLFCEKKLLEIHLPNGKPGKSGSEAIQQLVTQITDFEDICVVFLLTKLERAEIQTKWFKALAGSAVLLEAKAVSLNQLSAWILNRFKKYQLTIESEALQIFTEKVEGNLMAANQEIEKMALIYPAGSVIGIDAVQQAIANVARFDVFQIAQAWMSADLVRLKRLLEGLMLSGEEPILLLWVISEDIRTLLKLSGALQKGQTIAMVKNSLRLWGDKQFFAQQAIKRITALRLIEALQLCAQIDRQIKGIEAGNAWHSIQNLLFSLAR